MTKVIDMFGINSAIFLFAFYLSHLLFLVALWALYTHFQIKKRTGLENCNLPEFTKQTGIKVTWLPKFCCCLVTRLCLTLCNPMGCSMPGVPVLHYFLDFPQTHVHWVSDAIQLYHPLSPSSPPAFNLSPASGSFPVSQLFVLGTQVLDFQL